MEYGVEQFDGRKMIASNPTIEMPTEEVGKQ